MMDLYVHMVYKPEDVHYKYFLEGLNKNIKLTFGLEPQATNYSILIGGRPKRSLIENNPYLKTLIIPFAGIPKETYSLLKEFPHINVHNIHHNAAITAEMAIALMLSAGKSLLPIDREFRKNNWQGRMTPSPMLYGKNAVILGYGAIGKKIARVCYALGMSVTAIRRGQSYQDGEISVKNIFSLDHELDRADVLHICLPQTPETTGLIDKKRLQKLPNEAILVNIGRAAVIDEEALYNALCSKKIFAGLDVWYNYPQKSVEENVSPTNFPFHTLDNVVMSPHRAARCDEVEFWRMKHLAQLLNAAATNQEMPNKIDFKYGY